MVLTQPRDSTIRRVAASSQSLWKGEFIAGIILGLGADMYTALETLLEKVLGLWSDATHVRHSILAQHKCMLSIKPNGLN